MKKLLTLITLSFILYSCDHPYFDPEGSGKNTQIIFVEIIPYTTILEFSDSQGNQGTEITTQAKPGDKIKWIPISDGLVITDIRLKGTNNIFSKSPKMKRRGVWEAKVSETAEGQVSYGVEYTIDGVLYYVDPDIKVQGG